MSDAPVLPLELIVEILSWLPVKPLMRFRCVSKTWNFLVFDHKFIKLHLERSSKNGHILLRFGELFYDDDEQMMVGYGAALCSINRLLENPSSTIDDSLNQLDNTNFIGTCNGLVCFRRSDGWGLGMIEHQFQLWNPATRIMSECSAPLCNIYGDWFDPVNCGFGFDELSNTYKVVVLLHDTVSQTREVIVHSMGDTCWRKILTCPTFSMLGCYIGQLASGTVNWLALRISGFDYQWTIDAIDQLVIFSYDLKNETCRYLLMPEGFVEGRFSEEEPYFGVLKGCLCLAHDHTKTDLVVWLMREFGVEKSWTQLVKVNYDIVGFQTFKGMPLCMSQDEDVVLLVSLDSTTSDVVLYNRKHNRIEHSEYAYEKSSFICHDYFESLVLPY